MPKRIYVGKLGGNVSENQLRGLFKRFGSVSRIELSSDKGHAYVEMADGADEAIRSLNRSNQWGKTIEVSPG